MSLTPSQWTWIPRTIAGILGAAALVAAIVAPLPEWMKDPIRDLMNSTITLSGISIGFLATATSVMLSMGDSAAMQRLKKHGSYTHLVDSSIDAVHWSFGLAAASVVGMMMNFSHHTWRHAFALAIWAGLLAMAAMSYYRMINMYWSTLRTGN